MNESQLSDNGPACTSFHLAFPQHVYCLVSSDGVSRSAERAEVLFCVRPALNAAVVLLD